MRADPVRLAVVLSAHRTEAVAVVPDGRPVATVHLASTGSWTADLATTLCDLLACGTVEPDSVRAVVLAGNWAAAALHRSEELVAVASVRLATPPRSALPPLTGWPRALRTAVSAGEVIVAGGRGVDGRELTPLDENRLRASLTNLRHSAAAVAITGTFSGISGDDERAAERVAESVLPGVPVVLSHELGVLGLLARENAAVLNAALTGVGHTVAAAIATTLADLHINAPCYLVRNDGTLMAAAQGARFPLLTYAGATASWLRGAAALTGLEDALVCSIDQAGASLGAVYSGRPRELAGPQRIAGVATSIRGPRISRVRLAERAPGKGNLVVAIERMRERRADHPLVLVGDVRQHVAPDLPGVSCVLTPPGAEVSAAIGAALAPVSATVEFVLPRSMPAEHRRAELAGQAIEHAVRNGADPAGTRVVELIEVPLPYLPQSPIRGLARAEGPPQGRVRSP